MGQISALLYKALLVAKRQKISLCVTLLSPLLSVLTMAAIKYTAEYFYNNRMKKQEDTFGFFPTYVVPVNLLNYRTWTEMEVLQRFYYLTDPLRVFRYSVESKADLPKVREFFDMDGIQPFSFKLFNRSIYVPLYKHIPAESNQQLNEKLIADVKMMEGKNYNWWNSTLPDSSLWITRFNENGLSMNVQQMNPKNPRDIRANAVNYLFYRFDKKRRYSQARIPTEGFISTINLMSNKFLQYTEHAIFYVPKIIAAVSAGWDSSGWLQMMEAAILALGVVLFPVALGLGFPLVLASLVSDRVKGTKQLLQAHGMKTESYWIANLVSPLIMLLISDVLFSIGAYLCTELAFFTETSLIIIALYVLGYNLAQITFAMFLSTFIKTVATAVFVGYILSIFMLLLSSAASLVVMPIPIPAPTWLFFIPQFTSVRLIYSISFQCLDSRCISSIFALKGEALRSMLWLFGMSAIYFVLALVLHEQSVRYKLMKLFSKENRGEHIELFDSGEKDASAIEFERMADMRDPGDLSTILLVKGVSKTFFSKSRTVRALIDFSLYIRRGGVFALLGPNGAGKTTLLSIITRAIAPSSGRVYLEGRDLSSYSDVSIGYCPQFDIIFDELTVRQHLKFFGMFKNSTGSELKYQVEEGMDRVDLSKERDKYGEELSGGMRRRLSLGIALMSTSPLVLLDEPSNGLDPFQRRLFWATVKKATRDKAVLLTTHLMEEAETLSHSVGIIVQGILRCVGTPSQLKQKYGFGPKLQIVWKKRTNEEQKNDTMRALKHSCPQFKLQRSFNNMDEYLVGQLSAKKMAEVIVTLKDQYSSIISEWSFNLPNLEDVFLKVIDKYSKASPRGLQDSIENNFQGSSAELGLLG